MLEHTLESPLDSKEIKSVNAKGNQSWIFIGRTDAEAEGAILWPPDVKNWFTGKYPDTGKDWRQEKGTTEDEMVGCHHRPDGRWVWASSWSWWSKGSLACCSPWGHKESDTTEWLNWTALGHLLMFIEDFDTWLTVFSPFQTATYILGTSVKAAHLIVLILQHFSISESWN